MEVPTVAIPLGNKTISLSIRREDLVHPTIPGNKFRKLKYNLAEARENGFDTLLTFGGAYSNHIAAVAEAGKISGFKTIGIIRGNELRGNFSENPTLSCAVKAGMQLEFAARDVYADKDNPAFLDGLKRRFGDFYLLPEGGTNALAVKGCGEILSPADACFDYICCAAGTGGTVAGIAESAFINQQIIAFPAVAGGFMRDAISRWTDKPFTVVGGYEFGGYAKTDDRLIAFINDFHQCYGVPLDPVYTGKMLFGVMDLIAKGFFPAGSKILAIHTGGLQGIAGMNRRLKRKGSITIDFDV